MSLDTIDQGISYLRELHISSLIYWVAGAIVLLFAIFILPEMIYFSTIVSVRKQMKELNASMKRIEEKLERAGGSVGGSNGGTGGIQKSGGPLPNSPQEIDKRTASSFPLQH